MIILLVLLFSASVYGMDSGESFECFFGEPEMEELQDGWKIEIAPYPPLRAPVSTPEDKSSQVPPQRNKILSSGSHLIIPAYKFTKVQEDRDKSDLLCSWARLMIKKNELEQKIALAGLIVTPSMSTQDASVYLQNNSTHEHLIVLKK